MKNSRRFLFAIVGLAALLAAPARTARAEEPESPLARAIAVAQSRTVKIYGAGIGREPGYATGLIVSGDGQILTASGVHLSAERLRVVLPDGTVHLAQVLRRSVPLQAALLKVDASTPEFFDISRPAAVEPGDWVAAISNAFKVADGREPLSASAGIVSLRTRIEARFGTQDVPYDAEGLVIDAVTSNPGAPGGALVAADGRLAGMLGKVAESKATGTRLNFAVPADLLAPLVAGELPPAAAADSPAPPAATGATLGVRLFTLTGPSSPAYVDRVVAGSAAGEAGIKTDDLIVAIAGQKIGTVRDYEAQLARLVPGQAVEVTIKRGGKLLNLSLTPQKK